VKSKIISIMIVAMIISMVPLLTFAADFVPPTSYGAPKDVGVVFNDDIKESDRWSFDIGFAASDACRTILKAHSDGSFEGAGYDSLHVSVQGDYKLDNGQWRSSLSGYEDWVFEQDSGFDPESGTWTGSWHIYDEYFSEAFPSGVLPGGGSYFDTHTMNLRVRFKVSFHHNDTQELYEYYSPWSSEVAYTNNHKIEDASALINHMPKLLSVTLKKNESGEPYLAFKADKAHSDLQLLSSVSGQRVYTNVWIRLNGGNWIDAISYLWLKEDFDVDTNDAGLEALTEDTNFEVKFRYSFDNAFYPVAGKTGYVYSPFSNTISHGMPAYEGASSWATTELDKAADYGLITDRIKGNMSGKITREEFAEIAVKFYENYTGLKATVGDARFIDTTNPEILKAANLNLVSGVGNNKYAPNDLITRQQMATILLRALKAMKPDSDYSTTDVAKFGDHSLIKSWAIDGVYYCAKVKIVTGVGNNMYAPEGDAPREQAVIVCKRAFELFKSMDE
jgi:hypothetical protein